MLDFELPIIAGYAAIVIIMKVTVLEMNCHLLHASMIRAEEW